MSFGTGKIWMNGSLVEWADARIHIGSHVIHYGSGVFEGARCYATPRGSASFRIDEHIERLINSGRIYRMDSPLDKNGWLEHMKLNPKTGLDPDNIKIRAAEGLTSADYLFTG